MKKNNNTQTNTISLRVLFILLGITFIVTSATAKPYLNGAGTAESKYFTAHLNSHLKGSNDGVPVADKITGMVTDEENQPLPGVSIKVVGTTISTVTDVNGKYSISLPSGKTDLSFTYVGFISQTVSVGKTNILNVSLKVQVSTLNEVVVIGYGSQRRADVTSAITTAKSKEFIQGPVTDAAELLKGKVAGLSITNPTADPSATSQINLRGTGTLLGVNTGVLVIIDGVPGDLKTVAPEDIEEESVLKDGSAAAIYGVRGSNGVIIITTKHAKSDGISHVDYSSNITIGQITRAPQLFTAQDYRNQIAQGIRDASYDVGSSTDWMKAITKRAPASTVQNLSFNGGNSTTNYIASINYRHLNGIFIGSDNSAVNARVAINHSMLNGKLKFNLGIQQQNDNNLAAFGGFQYGMAMQMDPTAPVKNPDGTYYQQPTNFAYQNPISDVYNSSQTNSFFNSKYNATITALPLEGLQLQATASYNKGGYQNLYYGNHQNISTLRDAQNGVANIYQGQNVSRFLNFTAQYERSIGYHHFSVLAGYEYSDYNSFGTTISNHNFPTDYFGYNQVQLGTAQKNGLDVINSGATINNLISYFGRVTYNYKERYILLASMRIDGASQLYGSSEPFGKFPSIQAGWRITNEPFMKGQQIFDNLKLRAAYGITGNPPAAGFLATSLLGYGNYVLYNNLWIKTLSPSQNANPALKWEEKHETNLGLDYSLLKGRITGSIDVYDRRVSGLLNNYSVPSPPNLYPTTEANVGTMENKGLEVTLNIIPVKSINVQWATTFTFSTNSNKLVSLSNQIYQASVNYFNQGYTGAPIQTYTHRVQVGEPIGNFYGFKVVGVDKSGYWTYQEPNGQEVTYANFKHADGDKQVIGNGLPKFYAGWNNSVTYKNWSLNITQRGAFGFQILNSQRMFDENPSVKNYNRLNTAYNNVFGVTPLNKNVPLELNSYYIEKGDYWKIDQIYVGYTFAKLQSKYIHNLSIGISTLNTFVITGYKGIDPEVNESGLTPGIDGQFTYPSQRQYIFSLSASF